MFPVEQPLSPYNQYWLEFRPFFEAMCKVMAENHELKGDTWKTTCSEAYLLDRMTVQFEDMQNRDDEPFYVNIANYAAMLWLRFSEGTKP